MESERDRVAYVVLLENVSAFTTRRVDSLIWSIKGLVAYICR